MKLLGKIVVILIAALMVAGATLALDNSGALSSLTSRGRGERGERHATASADADSVRAAGEWPERGEGGEFHDGEGSRDWASGLTGVARNLGIVAAVIAGVWLISRLGGQTAIRRKLSKVEMPPPLKEEDNLAEKSSP